MEPKISISKTFAFEAAHTIPHHPGKCSRMHGHSYRLEVIVAGPIQTEGEAKGMVVDFGEISMVVEREVISQFDHQFLNDLVDYPTTAENLALDIFKRLTHAGLPVDTIKLWETAKCCAIISANK
jgi:6-pyruvoyltetrahydropterin/6-carboxytetrahydropterin synthase